MEWHPVSEQPPKVEKSYLVALADPHVRYDHAINRNDIPMIADYGMFYTVKWFNPETGKTEPMPNQEINRDWTVFFMGRHVIINSDVTHWMELPELP